MAADPRDLTTVAKVQAFVSGAPSDATLLQDLVTRASVFIESYLSRDLVPTTYTEKRNGADQRAIPARQWPILSVTSVTIDNLAIPLSTSVGMPGYVFDDKFIYLRGYKFTRGVQNIELVYKAGFDDGNGKLAAPPDLEQACLELINEKIARRLRPGVVSKGLEGQTITFSTNDLTPSIKSTLANYKKVWDQP